MNDGIRTDLLDDFGRTAKNAADVLEIDLKDAAKQVSEAFTAGYESVQKIDKATNAYTATELEHIRTLFEAGRAEDARSEAFRIFSERMDKGAKAMRGPWSEAIKSLGTAWDGLLNRLADSAPIQAAIAVLDLLATKANEAAGGTGQA